MEQTTGRRISRFTMARRLHKGGLFTRRLVRCVDINACSFETSVSVVPRTQDVDTKRVGRALFTDESR